MPPYPPPIALVDALAAREAVGNGTITPTFTELPPATQERYRDIARSKLEVLTAPCFYDHMRAWVEVMAHGQ